MGKPTREVYDKFVNKYFQINKQIDKKQFLVPYLMSSHPGSDLNAAIDLALYIKEMGYTPEQVQDFLPNTRKLINNNVLYWIQPNYRRKSLYSKNTRRERNAKSSNTVCCS